MTKDLKKEQYIKDEALRTTYPLALKRGIAIGKQAQYEKDTELMNAMFLRGKEKQKQADFQNKLKIKEEIGKLMQYCRHNQEALDRLCRIIKLMEFNK